MSQISVASHPSQITRVNVHDIRGSEPIDYRLTSAKVKSGNSVYSGVISDIGEVFQEPVKPSSEPTPTDRSLPVNQCHRWLIGAGILIALLTAITTIIVAIKYRS